MRKVMRKNMATAARLPHKTICIGICPLLSALPAGPMVGAGMTSRWGQFFKGDHMGLEGLVLLQRENTFRIPSLERLSIPGVKIPNQGLEKWLSG